VTKFLVSYDDVTQTLPPVVEAKLSVTYATVKVVGPGVGGAVGNGIADDTAAIQAALDAAAISTATRTVRLMRGTYVVSRVSVASRVLVEGDGATLLHKAGALTSAIFIPSTSADVTVRGVTLDGNTANQTVELAGIEAQGPRAIIEGCTVYATTGKGIVLATTASGSRIYGNRVSSVGAAGIDIAGADHVAVVANVIDVTGGAGIGIASGSQFVTVTGNVIKSSGLDGVVAYESNLRDITVSGNTIESPGNHGIHLGGSGLVIADNVIRGVMVGSGAFVRNHDSTRAYGISITGNVISGAVMSGVRVEIGEAVAVTGNVAIGTADGIYLDSVTNVTVTGNTLQDTVSGPGIRLSNFAGATLVGNLVEVSASDCIYALDGVVLTVQGNSVRSNTAGRGIRLMRVRRAAITGNSIYYVAGEGIYGGDGGDAVNYSQLVTVTGNVIALPTGRGIYSAESSNRWLVDANVISGWTTAPITLAGANNVTGTNLTA